jgi:hypothetical protein
VLTALFPAMTLAEFKHSVPKTKPPPDLTPALAALWWEGKGDWDRAHALVMDESGLDCAWVHAYLHRVEGDLGNARYWYAQAARPTPTGQLRAEWDSIAAALLAAAEA